jgi:Family of unknown function (DUF6152)
MSKRSVAALVIAAGLTAAGTAAAHHSFTQFDRKTEIVTTGTIVRWAFNNPHSWLYLKVPNADGSDTLWSFEGSGPTHLIERGITGATFEPGKEITIMFCPMVDGRPGGHMGWALLADGSMVNPSDGGCNGDDATIERWKGWLAKGFKSNKEAMAAE